MKNKIDNKLFSAILYIVVGVLLAVFKGSVLGWALYGIAAFFIITGALDLIKQNWVQGGISVGIGVAIIVVNALVNLIWIVLLVLGVLIAFKGIAALINAIKYDTTALGLLFPVLTILAGVGLAFGGLASIIILIVGIYLAVVGALGLIGALKK